MLSEYLHGNTFGPKLIFQVSLFPPFSLTLSPLILSDNTYLENPVYNTYSEYLFRIPEYLVLTYYTRRRIFFVFGVNLYQCLGPSYRLVRSNKVKETENDQGSTFQISEKEEQCKGFKCTTFFNSPHIVRTGPYTFFSPYTF